MRGFPLLSTLLVLAGFAVAWWPLKQSATGSGAILAEVPLPTAETEAESAKGSSESEVSPASLRIFSSAPLTSIRIESLGEMLIEETTPTAGTAIERELPAFAIPAEGVEFWVEATFAEDAGSQPAALGVELAPIDRDARTVTLWTDEFDRTSVADSVAFTWGAP